MDRLLDLLPALQIPFAFQSELVFSMSLFYFMFNLHLLSTSCQATDCNSISMTATNITSAHKKTPDFFTHHQLRSG